MQLYLHALYLQEYEKFYFIFFFLSVNLRLYFNNSYIFSFEFVNFRFSRKFRIVERTEKEQLILYSKLSRLENSAQILCASFFSCLQSNSPNHKRTSFFFVASFSNNNKRKKHYYTLFHLYNINHQTIKTRIFKNLDKYLWYEIMFYFVNNL